MNTIAKSITLSLGWITSSYVCVSVWFAGLVFDPLDWSGGAVYSFILLGVVLGIGFGLLVWTEEREKMQSSR